MEVALTRENLHKAWKRVKANKGAAGSDELDIEQTAEVLRRRWSDIRQALLAGTYRPAPVRRVMIPKPDGSQRELGIPTVLDRLIQQALLQVLQPLIDPSFSEHSHGFRPARRAHDAVKAARAYVQAGKRVVVDVDLSKFFDRVNHDILMDRLGKRIDDAGVIRLVRAYLNAGIMDGGVVLERHLGTPQGGPLSPLLANVLLDEVDKALEARGYSFARYADDCNVYVGSQRAGQRVMDNLTRFIEGRLRLKVNLSKSAVARPEERHFLGFRLRREPHSGETEVYLSKRTIDRAHQKIRELTPRNWGQSLRDCIRGLNAYLTGWFGFFRICTEAGAREFQSLDGRIRRRLRAIVLKQWKSKRIQAKQLIRLGVNRWLVWNTLYKGRRSLWFLSHTEPVDRGLRTAYFAKRGLVSLTVRWKETIAKPVVAPARKRRARATAGSNASVGSRD